MEIKNNILRVLPLTALLLISGVGTLAGNVSVEEGAFDVFNNGPSINVRKEGFIGSDEELQYSNIYSQYGIDSDNNYWVRFAIAVKGDVASLAYVRNAVPELNETEGVQKEIKTVYKGITSNGVTTYYNPETGLSTNEEDAGNYYWACYSIKIENPDYYSSTIAMSFKVDDEVVAERRVSLNNLLGVENVYRFEAENANIVGNSGSGSTNDAGHRCFETSTYISPKFSGGICIRNNYHFKTTFDFDASVKDDFAKVRLFMSTRGEAPLSTVYSMTVNGTDVDLSNIRIPATGETYIPSSIYFNMTEVLVPISLIKGSNSILIAHGSSGSSANLDYIEVITSSEVSNFVDSPMIDSENYTMEVSKIPTHRSEGTLKVTCTHPEYGEEHASTTYALPMLTDTSFYNSVRDDENNLTNVEFAISGKTVSFAYKNSYTLKLNGATFEDGSFEKTFTIEEITAGEADKIVPITPDGHSLVGWYDVDDAIYNSGTKYTMGYANDSIEAVYKPTNYIKAGNGYLDFGVQASQTFFDNTQNITNHESNNQRKLGYITHNRYGTILNFSCTADTSHFRIKTGYDRQENVTYAQEYTISNLGKEEISFNLDQVNTSTTKVGFAHTVTLKPGEATTFTIEFQFAGTNAHLLSLFSFTKQYSNCSLGVISSIKVIN